MKNFLLFILIFLVKGEFLFGSTNITTESLLKKFWDKKDYEIIHQVAAARLRLDPNDRIGLFAKVELIILTTFDEKDANQLENALNKLDKQYQNLKDSEDDKIFEKSYRIYYKAARESLAVLRSDDELEKERRREKNRKIFENPKYYPLFISYIDQLNPPPKNFAPRSGVPEFEGDSASAQFSWKNSIGIGVVLLVIIGGLIFIVRKQRAIR